MLRKTVSIDEYLFTQLEQEGVLDRFKNFSDLVSSSLRNTMESVRREGYRKQLEQMVSDPMVIEDISRIEEDFRYADGELDVF